MYNNNYTYELYHHGIKGQRWGVRRTKEQLGYRSTSIKSVFARRSNAKVDDSFKKWDENTKKKNDAIELGKKANAAKLAYEKDKSNKDLKNEYKQANKDYKKALNSNTTYRKGVVKQDVGRDAARKYLSEAKKVKKQLDTDPQNKELQKKYNELMSKHDVERADARRAVEVSSKRSQTKANIKRNMTKTVKAVAATAVVSVGAYAANRYLNEHEVTVNGKRIQFSTQNISNLMETAKKVKDLGGYFY